MCAHPLLQASRAQMRLCNSLTTTQQLVCWSAATSVKKNGVTVHVCHIANMSDQNYQHKQINTVTRCFICVTCSGEIHQLLLHCGLQAGYWALLRGELRDVIVHEVVHESLGTCRREFMATLMKLIMIAMCFKLISSLAQSHTHRRFPFHVPANESNQQNIVATMGNKTTKSLKY